MFDIKEKVALITGGASGLGLRYAKELLQNGLKGVALADINEEIAQKALQEISAEFGPNRAIFVKTDVSSKAQFEEAFKATIKQFKNVDILINNAGILNDAIWEKQILINVNGTIHGIILGLDHYIPKYKTGSEGVIVNISSIAGLDPFDTVPVYTGTKHAVIGISRSYGSENHYNRSKVKVLTMCPGVTDTALFDDIGEKTLGPGYVELLANEPLDTQPPEFVARAMVQIIKEAKNGSVWLSEDKNPVVEVPFPTRQERVKQ